jgi:hypothetical protein
VGLLQKTNGWGKAGLGKEVSEGKEEIVRVMAACFFAFVSSFNSKESDTFCYFPRCFDSLEFVQQVGKQYFLLSPKVV